jgi:Protein of unknown function (DUF3775)
MSRKERRPVMKNISPRTVAHVILRARELDVKVARWDGPGDSTDGGTILQSRSSDATERELRAFISGLNFDEQRALVVIMWIGRETFAPVEWDEAIQTVRTDLNISAEEYLIGVPLLAEYLEAGLERLGIDPGLEEDEIYADR